MAIVSFGNMLKSCFISLLVFLSSHYALGSIFTAISIDWSKACDSWRSCEGDDGVSELELFMRSLWWIWGVCIIIWWASWVDLGLEGRQWGKFDVFHWALQCCSVICHTHFQDHTVTLSGFGTCWTDRDINLNSKKKCGATPQVSTET